jgi:hypothetical protein
LMCIHLCCWYFHHFLTSCRCLLRSWMSLSDVFTGYPSSKRNNCSVCNFPCISKRLSWLHLDVLIFCLILFWPRSNV